MARIRSIKIDLFVDDALADVSLAAHLLLAGLPVIADSAGRLEDRPRRIHAQLFPYRPEVDTDACLNELARAGAVTRYVVDGVRYLEVAGWTKDQRPHVKEAPSVIPPPLDSTEPRLGSELAGNSPGTRPDKSAGIRDSGLGVLDSGSGVSASQEPESVPERPQFVLTAQKFGKRPRKPSAAESLFATLQAMRAARCDEVGEPWVEENWPHARRNRDLKPLVEASGEAQALFEAAWGLYLADDGERVREPAWSLSWFMASGVRARYETRAARGEGT